MGACQTAALPRSLSSPEGEATAACRDTKFYACNRDSNHQ